MVYSDIKRTYRDRLEKKSLDMPYFIRKFHRQRLVKSIILLPVALVCSFFSPNMKDMNVVYRPKKRERENVLRWKNVLLLGDFSDFRFARANGVKFFPFWHFYSFLNLGLFGRVTRYFETAAPRRIVVFSDMGLDATAFSSYAKKYHFKLWCFQHGLFPFQHSGVLDGELCSINVVNSLTQKKILRDSGYRGKTISSPSFFYKYDRANILEWTNKKCPVIFIGPGYIENETRRELIDAILTELRRVLPARYRLLYRPHPRERRGEISNVVRNFVSDNDDTDVNAASTLIYIGIKSTMLFDAQESGRLSILVEDEGLPKYFQDGEISTVVEKNSLHLVPGIIDEFIEKV